MCVCARARARARVCVCVCVVCARACVRACTQETEKKREVGVYRTYFAHSLLSLFGSNGIGKGGHFVIAID